MIQHPVGQGGLLSGTLHCGANPLRWIYDCGSNQFDPLQREIARIAADGDVDILFLSHLDSDHVRGVDHLLTTLGVTEVVLPYLGEVDRLFLVCRDIDAGSLTGTFLDFTVDPALWLINRGVQTVTFIIGPNDDDGLGESPGLPPDDSGGGEGPVKYKWSLPADDQRQVNGAAVRNMSTSAVVQCWGRQHLLNWVLAPYAHRPSAGRIQKFRRALRAAFDDQSIEQIVSKARRKSDRQKLRRCYDALWDNHNLVSMSLYAGPLNSVAKAWIHSYWNRASWKLYPPEFGWLSTGDAYLRSAQRRKALLRHFQRFLAHVAVLVVPHHGADTYFHPDLIASFPHLHLGIAAAGKNGYGHPHDSVREAFESRSRVFQKVGEVPSSQSAMCAEL